MSSISSFISFPNYRLVVRSNQVVNYGNYSSIEDIINHLYKLNFHSHHIREVYNTFRNSISLQQTLRSVRACIIQCEHVCCTIDKIHVLENRNTSVITERVMYIKMYEYTGGKRRKCTPIMLVYLGLVLFACFGIAVCVWAIRTMFIKRGSQANP